MHSYAAQHRRPLWLGVLLASLAPPLCMLTVLFFSRTDNPSITDMLNTGMVAFAVTFPVSLCAKLALGLPFVLWLRSRKALNSMLICAGAVAVGVFTLALLTWVLSWDHRAPDLPQLLYGAGLGLAAGIAFCIGAGPNNSFKPKPLRGSA